MLIVCLLISLFRDIDASLLANFLGPTLASIATATVSRVVSLFTTIMWNL